MKLQKNFVNKNPIFCIPTVVDKQHKSYNITAVFENKGYLSDINAFDICQKWYQQQRSLKRGITVTILQYQHIKPQELNDDSFIYNINNRILEYVYNSNFDDEVAKTNNKRQEIIKQFNGQIIRIKSFQQLRSHETIKSLIKNLQDKENGLSLIALFIELKWKQIAFRLSMVSRKNDKTEDSVLLAMFMMNNNIQIINDDMFSEEDEFEEEFEEEFEDEFEEKVEVEEEEEFEEEHDAFDDEMIIKCCLMTKRSVWCRANYTKHPFFQIYWYLVCFSKFWLNLLYSLIKIGWQRNCLDGGSVLVMPFAFKSQYITYLWEKHLKMDDPKKFDIVGYMDRKYLIRDEFKPTPRGPKEYEFAREEYIDICVGSKDGIFTVKDIKAMMANIEKDGVFHFILNYQTFGNIKQETNENVDVAKLKSGTESYYREYVKYMHRDAISQQIIKEMDEKKRLQTVMSEYNAIKLRQFMVENRDTININIECCRKPCFWPMIEAKLKYFFNIIKYQFGFMFESPTNCFSFTIPIYDLICGEKKVYFQNSELLLMIVCLEEVVVYTGHISLFCIPGRIYTFDEHSLPTKQITICHNDKKCIVLMLRTSPWINDNKIKFLDLNALADGLRKKNETGNETEKEKYEMIEKIVRIDDGEQYKVDYKYKYFDSPQLISQTVLHCEELTAEIKDKRVSKDIHSRKVLINKGLDIENVQQQREYFQHLFSSKQYTNAYIEILFYLGNSYEGKGDHKVAILYYQQSLVVSAANNKYMSAVTIQHKYECLKQIQIQIQNDAMLSVLSDLAECCKHCTSAEEKYKKIRRQWVLDGAVQYELMGAAQCALCLAQHYEDEQEKRWNDKSLIWYKKSINILEQLGVITVDVVSIDKIIDSLNEHVERPKNVILQIVRKRINKYCQPKRYIHFTETTIQCYLQCLIERFRKKDYEIYNDTKMAANVCFNDFRVNGKWKYDGDFDKYLQIELDSMFEMIHSHWQCNVQNAIHISKKEMADVYNNYAIFLSQVRDFDGALLWNEEALEWNESDEIILYNVAEIYEKRQQYEIAKIYYHKALAETDVEDVATYREMERDVKASFERIDKLMKRSKL